MAALALNKWIKALAVATALISASAAGAQDSRENPFLPNSTPEEERLIAERERMRQIVREMMPEVRSMLAPAFEEQRQQIDEMIRTGVSEAVRTDPELLRAFEEMRTRSPMATPVSADGAVEGDAQAQSGAARLPEGARFHACVNGKAMYRDSGGISFFFEPGPGKPSPCAY